MKSQFEQYDGRSVTPFEKVAKSPPTAATWNELAQLAGDADGKCQIGATWVAKKWLEVGHSIPDSVGEDLLALLGHFDEKNATLHVLQIFDRLSLGEIDPDALFDRLEAIRVGKHRFIQAWALSAMVSLADRFERFRADVLVRIEEAEQGAASMRARARALVRQFEWCRFEA